MEIRKKSGLTFYEFDPVIYPRKVLVMDAYNESLKGKG